MICVDCRNRRHQACIERNGPDSTWCCCAHKREGVNRQLVPELEQDVQSVVE